MNDTTTDFASELRLPLKWVAALMALVGWILAVTVSAQHAPLLQIRLALISTMVQVVAIIAWRLDRRYSRASRWLVIALMMGTVFVVSHDWQWPSFMVLLVVPTALTAPLISRQAVWITASIETLLLLAGMNVGWIEPAVTLTSLIAIWAMAGIMHGVYGSILHLVEWIEDYNRRAHVQLEEARDHKVRLSQALDDLTHANVQLTRLNLLAQGLRQAAEDGRIVKEQFVANVSHELRTPLNMITGFSDMILQAPEMYGSRIPPALLADLAVIHRNADHLSNLINDVLDLSQIEAERMALSREYVAMDELITEAVTSVRPLYELRGLYLKTMVEEELPPLFCDRTRIQEVLLNLLSNAGRFTERGGVELWAASNGAELVISVADTGPGIAPENLGKLFQPFWQLDGSLRRRHAGTGLGLSISKRFIELHDGKIWVESELGKGTTFWFRLPLRPPTEGPRSGRATRWLNPEWEFVQRMQPSTVPVAVVHPRLVVLEESDGLLQRLLVRHLDNVEVVPVSSLEEAQAELAHTPADALVINSASVSREIGRIEAGAVLPKDVPALICAVPGLREASNAVGASQFLVKPISSEMLLDALDRLQLMQGTILIVDDEPDALQLFGRLLLSFGRDYRVLLARDGQEAMEVLRECRPDLILLDLVMPKMDGFQILHELRDDRTLQNIPVLVISARDPVGGPIVSRSLAITRQGGMSVMEVLAYIKSLIQGHQLTGQATDPTSTEVPRA